MPEFDLCDAGLLQPFVRCMEARSVPTEQYLERAHISPLQIASGAGKITRRQAWQFCKLAEDREGFDALGFLHGDPYSIADLGGAGELIQQAVTLQDAILSFCRLLPTIVDGNTAHLIRGEKFSWLVIRSEQFDYQAVAADHYTILPLREIIRLAAGSNWRPTAIKLLTGPRKILKKLPDTGDIELLHNQDVVGVAFETALLSAPLRIRGTVKHSEPKTGLPVESDSTVSGSIYQLLTSLNTYRTIPTARETAEMFGISRAKLCRKLSEESISYSYITDRIRYESAIELLADSTLGIKGIAYVLGYSAPSNFCRAFHRLSGVSPSEYRRNLFET